MANEELHSEREAVGAIDARSAELRNAKIRDSNHRLHSFLNTLQELVVALDVPCEDDQVMTFLARSLDALLETIDSPIGNLLVLDDVNSQLVCVLANGSDASEKMAWRQIDSASGIAGWVLLQNEAVIANDAPADERFNPDTDVPNGINVETLMAIPVVSREQRIGVITVMNKRGDGMFTDDDQTLAWLMGRFAGELLHRMSK